MDRPVTTLFMLMSADGKPQVAFEAGNFELSER